MTIIADQGTESIDTEPWRLGSAEAAALLQVSPRTVARWADDGLLPYTRTAGGRRAGGHRRFREADVEALRARLCTPGGGAG